MASDFKKGYKEFYMPKNKPTIVTVPKANYIAVRGKGNPNEEEAIWDIVRLIRLKVITSDDLSEFSEELRQEVKRILEMNR